MATTIEDLEAAAADLGTAIHQFHDDAAKATKDRATAQAADAVAVGSETTADTSKQAMVDSHAAFDLALESFLQPTPPV